MGIGRTQEESWTKAAPSASHVSMQRAHVIMLRPQMHGRCKVTATTIIPDANLTSSTTASYSLIRVQLRYFRSANNTVSILNVVIKVMQKKSTLHESYIVQFNTRTLPKESRTNSYIKIINFSLTVSQN